MPNTDLPDTSSSPVGLAAGAAVAGIAVLIILTVVVVLVVWLWRYSLYTIAVTNTACLHTDTCRASTKIVYTNIYAGGNGTVKKKMQVYHCS